MGMGGQKTVLSSHTCDQTKYFKLCDLSGTSFIIVKIYVQISDMQIQIQIPGIKIFLVL